MIPVNKGTPDNFDRFERVLENNSDIDTMRKVADRLFPDDSHKLTPLPNNPDLGYCEFWTGNLNSSKTLNKLFAISKAEIKSIYDQTNNAIASNAIRF